MIINFLDIIREGSSFHYVYFIISGQVKVIKNGSECLLVGETIGQPVPFHTKRTLRVICSTVCEFFVLDYGKYLNLNC
jgi:signal-transduction protein with cAMP-binding, CBS, and nucleotidyltransferase domain